MSVTTIDPARRRFEAAGVLWPTAFDDLFHSAPEFVDAYLQWTVTTRQHAALDPKVREFIHIALDIATTHMDRDGAVFHIRQAIKLGATRAELLHVCQLSTLLGVHTMPMAMSILIEESTRAGQPPNLEPGPLGAQVRERFVAARGALPEEVEALLAIHPEYLDSYRRVSRIAMAEGVIEPKVVELIVIALDAATTHLHAGGTRLHIRSALAKGASFDEVLEVLELTSTIGICGTTFGVQLVTEAFADMT